MRFTTKIATLVVLSVMQTQTPANGLPATILVGALNIWVRLGELQIAASSPLSSAGQR